MTPAQLDHVLFPVGELRKTDVRAMAERFGIPTARKAESQETCFAVDGEYAAVVAQRNPEAFVPGDVVDMRGDVLGRHDGVGNFTVGQRKGIGVGGSSRPLYVVDVEPDTRRVVVGPREALAVSEIVCEDVAWNGGTVDVVDVAVRYRMRPVPARVHVADGRLEVTLDQPVEGVARGQSVVCYQGDVVVGGGVITCAS